MIVKMNHLDLVCVEAERETTLERLRSLGAVHLDLASATGAEVAAAEGAVADAEKAVRLIRKARESSRNESVRPLEVGEILAAAAHRDELSQSADELSREIRLYEPYGDFDPDLARELSGRGIDVRLRSDGTFDIGCGGEKPRGDDLPLPALRLGEMRARLEFIRREIAGETAKIAAGDENAILKLFPALADRIAFASARALMASRGALATISGWVPAPSAAKIRAAAAENGWGVLLREPSGGETPPTLVEPPRLFRPMKALFAGLGIAPAYNESDVSVPFFCYFAIFFAMLVGDGAYGAIFLAATLAMRKRLPRAWFALLGVFSLATIAWGLLSNTWFGAGIPACADWPTVAWLADPSYHNMMFLCFTIGVSHLMLARLWSGICKLPDSTAVADFGWAGVLLFMYLVTNAIVGIMPSIPVWGFYVFGAAVVAVFGFTVKPSELKTRGAELGMLPLNIMSALGDIISYVRLFAVGLASVKVAENFNSMATGLIADDQSLWLKAVMAVAMAAILIVGHALNLAMAGLSILVHAVRLNTLEFSNHKGVTWSGYDYRPFRRREAKQASA